jgi:hypothetical protein
MTTNRHNMSFHQSFWFLLIICLSACYFCLIRVYIGFLDFFICTRLSYVLFPSLSNSLVFPGIPFFPHFQQSLYASYPTHHHFYSPQSHNIWTGIINFNIHVKALWFVTVITSSPYICQNCVYSHRMAINSLLVAEKVSSVVWQVFSQLPWFKMPPIPLQLTSSIIITFQNGVL